MKGRPQKISTNETCPQKNRTTSEGYVRGQTFMWITENNLTNENRLGYGLLEFILSPTNLNSAYRYFKLADINSLLQRVDEWYRRRLRMVIWKQWKRIKTKLVNLVKLGVKKSKAWEWANTRKGYWHTAKSFIVATTIITDRLREAGYIFLSDYYKRSTS
jgi:hypothetical protein